MRHGAPVKPPESIAADRPSESELLATLPVAVLGVAPDGRIAYANTEAEQLLNLSERSMTGPPL